MTSRWRDRLSRRACALLVVWVGTIANAGAAVLPSGFNETVVASGLASPTAMQFAPDGRLFVCEQGGQLRVIKNGALLATPFVALTVDSAGERGLLGVAFDPAFASNHFVYVYYTATTPTIHNRISRFTANGDVAAAGSETILFDLPTLGATNHNGGALAFGPDGKLYAAVGENATPSNAQSLTTVLGKMLRINADGTIPSDNPFFGSTTGNNRAIWAMGLRNPFTFAFNAAGTRMFINDVGQSMWEEIDDGAAGANYGWPTFEGVSSAPGFVSPRYAYDHSAGTCAITGGAFYDPATMQFPPAYANVYFFADFCAGWIKTLNPSAGNAVTTFATGIASPVDLKVAADGSLYYLARGAGAVVRVVSSVPSAVSVAPAAGSGTAQTFSLQFADTAGATALASTWVWFSASFAASSANSCMVYLDRPSGVLHLLNDAGTQWITATLGAGGSLDNSQCSVLLGGATSAATSGTTLTLTLSMTFTAAFAGPKSIFMFAGDMFQNGSGWQTGGTWTVPASSLSADSVAPSAGSGATQTFALAFSDTAGAADIATTWVWFEASLASSVVQSCLMYYDRASNVLRLLNDAGSVWLAATVGSAGTLQNSQCVVTLDGSTTVVSSGNTLTVNLAMTFRPAFAGSKSVFMYAANGARTATGWQTRGTWTVPATVVTVSADSVAPNAGSGASQAFAFHYSDSAGAGDVATAWVWINGSFNTGAANSCLFYYDQNARTLSLLNDAATAWMTGMLGGAGVLANTRCSIALSSVVATATGTALTVTVPITFSAPFAGAKSIFMFASNASGSSSGWQTRGSWTVP